MGSPRSVGVVAAVQGTFPLDSMPGKPRSWIDICDPSLVSCQQSLRLPARILLLVHLPYGMLEQSFATASGPARSVSRGRRKRRHDVWLTDHLNGFEQDLGRSNDYDTHSRTPE